MARGVAKQFDSITEAQAMTIRTLAGVEKETILAAMKATGYDRSEAARLLGIGRTTLYRKLKEYGYRPGKRESGK